MASLEFETIVLHAEDERKKRLASLVICGNARNVEDARFLLKACGIIPDPDAKPVHHIVKLGPVTTRPKRKTTDD